MKFALIIFFSLHIVMDFQAQAVTIGHESIPVEYFRLPDQPLPSNYSTYTPDISIPFNELSKIGLSEASLVDQYLGLQGYRKVSSGGDILIEAGISEFTIWGENRNTRRTKTKDKEGNEQIKYSYSMEVRYSVPVSLHVSDKQGNTLLDKRIYTHADTRTWTSSSYNSMNELDNYWRYQRPTRLIELHKGLLTEGLNQIESLINSQFGYSRIKDKIRFETIGKKTHPEYDAYQQQVELIKTAFTMMSADKSLDPVKEKVKSALTFYKTNGQKCKPGDKNGERLKHICYYNVALAYFWLEDFEQAAANAEEIQKFEPKDKDARRLLDDIVYVKDSLQRNGRSSRHMVVVGSKT